MEEKTQRGFPDNELLNIAEWMVCNKQTINVNKTYCILFTNRKNYMIQHMNVLMHGSDIDFSLTGKFLGAKIANIKF